MNNLKTGILLTLLTALFVFVGKRRNIMKILTWDGTGTITIHKRLLAEHPETHLILTVHDELVFEVPDSEMEAVSQLAQTEMESVAELRVPLVVDLGHGRTWYAAKA